VANLTRPSLWRKIFRGSQLITST